MTTAHQRLIEVLSDVEVEFDVTVRYLSGAERDQIASLVLAELEVLPMDSSRAPVPSVRVPFHEWAHGYENGYNDARREILGLEP